ncbi:hypothetical protein ASPWEDRAFT_55995 [Aspergillus wentii DTO 134E9]|uniref:UmuC domain-containing protein n=1 Tax=Aspergillus wentii DTO 134E9 TaxID=1073089 RepID=A0A1L9S0D8_ASPWE|nr:uncharacterized protein ASPWEDRAFT_55995 [Aspergillus wentii DTO 134E9]KAI9931364.1 hypothetical protein MW887_011028 [Aspergillus wentii]OJJ40622.1 hypothetical protein ASPWEDRAFT_55995 [Aspergillus wentii DTO 134E9]
MAAPPSRDDSRIIIHFDYDCFYASVFEAEQPVLKSLPLAVQQKQIVVTCNYEARRRGLRKLQLIKEAKQTCPDLVIVLGEDLTRFRDASKDLYLFLRAFVWGGRVEKLGFDELFLDTTEMIEYNVDVLNRNDLANSFFHLDRQDPTVGFLYDATTFHGPTYPPDPDVVEPSSKAQPGSDRLCIRLLVASHLAGYLRSQLEYLKGYTASVGISTSKLLSKLAGNVHKPNSLTTLLPPYVPGEQGAVSNVTKFLDDHEIRKIPGIGSKLANKLKTHILGTDAGSDDKITVQDVRLFPGIGPALLEKILGGPGSPRGIGLRVWGLIHGVDTSEVSEARDLPTQISIEDSYGCLDSLEGVKKELVALSASLIRRMRTDLTELDHESDQAISKPRWLAHPKTLRLSTRPRSLPTDGGRSRSYNNRISRSAPLPQYVFNLDDNVEALAEKLVQEHALSMFRTLHPEKSGWNLSLLNIAVTNMVESAGEQKKSSGRDIQKMFRNQETVLKDWKVPETDVRSTDMPDAVDHPSSSVEESSATPLATHDAPENAWEDSDEEETMPSVACGSCGVLIPHFALVAHEMYHSATD